MTLKEPHEVCRVDGITKTDVNFSFSIRLSAFAEAYTCPPSMACALPGIKIIAINATPVAQLLHIPCASACASQRRVEADVQRRQDGHAGSHQHSGVRAVAAAAAHSISAVNGSTLAVA